MSRWFPMIPEIVHRPNPDRLNSAWIGLTAPIINLPNIVWRTMLVPLLVGLGAFVVGLVKASIALVGIPIALVIMSIGGLTGKLDTVFSEDESED